MKRMELKPDGKCRWRIPKSGSMRVDAVFYASERLLSPLKKDEALVQLANVAALPGIINCSLGMPDMHSGYGFPIGGVAAFETDGGVVSPGGVGYDINCGVRMISSTLGLPDVSDRLDDVLKAVARSVPAGVGSAGTMALNRKSLKKVCERGAAWALAQGYGEEYELERIEDAGCMQGADMAAASDRAVERGRGQMGTLGSGNHFVEIGYVSRVGFEKAARIFGLEEGNIVISIHCGSRGFGHQVCDDAVRRMSKSMHSYGISVPDRQLCAVPLGSKESDEYFAAMAAAANFAFANRQIIAHRVTRAVEGVLGVSPADAGFRLLYDVCHNIAKMEKHPAGGSRTVCVHRKGATRAFPAGHDLVPDVYASVGQPVLVPGDMGRKSFVLVGTDTALRETWGSLCHGAGRLLSRGKALKRAKGRSIFDELASNGVRLHAARHRTVAEEMPEAYKDVGDVVDTIVNAGLGTVVAETRPVAVLKG